MTALAQSRAQAAGRMPQSRAATARRESTGSGWTGLVTRIVIGAGLVLTAWQGWAHFSAEVPAPARAAIPTEAIVGVQITLGQAALALRDFGEGGLLSDRFDFEQGMSRVRRSVEALERFASEADERKALGRVKSQLERLMQIEKEHIVRLDAGGGSMGAQRLAEIATLRDGAALALRDFREVRVRRVAAAEPDPVSLLLRGSVDAGAGRLSPCSGARTLWNRLCAA
jgi:hypothetical protein